MAQWLYTYNVPLVMNNFFYLIMAAAFAVGIGFLIYAAGAMKKAEAHLPVDAEFAAAEEEKAAEKAAKKANKDA